tara:strand:+ start:602 stop:820 length:219 start_codon:yes stop_codon:yes gene_type:complete
MKTAPFKLKSGNKPEVAKMMGVSPAKKETPKGEEKPKQYSKENPHPLAGSFNEKKTKVVDFMGNWKRVNPRK